MSRLSTCARCGGTIRQEQTPLGLSWGHVAPLRFPHPADPDDGHVSGPSDDEAGDPL